MKREEEEKVVKEMEQGEEKKRSDKSGEIRGRGGGGRGEKEG